MERIAEEATDYGQDEKLSSKENDIDVEVLTDCQAQGGHSIVKNTGGWLDSLGSWILVGKDILGFYKNIDLDNS